MPKPDKSSPFMWEIEAEEALVNYGKKSHKSIKNRPLSILTIGMHAACNDLGVIPDKQHQIVDKKSGKIAYVERINCTLRQRNSKLVRKFLSFSKKQDNHIRSIKYFICHYNLALQV